MTYNWKDGLLDGATIPENSNGPLATLVATEGSIEAFSYSLSGAHKDFFQIDTYGRLSLKEALDYEALGNISSDRHFSVVVQAHSSDGQKQLDRSFILSLENLNDVATGWQNNGNPSGRLLAENNLVGASLDGFSATDGDSGAEVTYSLSGVDAGYFSIDASNGKLFLLSGLDFEDGHGVLYSVTVNADSGEGGGEGGISNAITQNYVLTVTDQVAEWLPSSLEDGAVVLENSAIGTALTNFAAIGPEGEIITYGLSNDLDGKYFEIDQYTGLLTTNAVFDYEDRDRYTVAVRANVGGDSNNASLQHYFVLTIANEDEFATSWQENGNPSGGSIIENNEVGLSLTDFSAIDGDRGVLVTYSLSGDDANYFNIDSASGVLSLKSSLDYEDSHAEYYSVVVNANSFDGSDGISSLYVLRVKNLEIEIDWMAGANASSAAIVNESDAIAGFSLANFNIASGGNVEVKGNNEVADDTKNISYFLSLNGDGVFTIDSDGTLRIRQGRDYETDYASHQYSVIVNTGLRNVEGSISQLFILSIANEDEFATGWVGTQTTGRALAENNSENLGLAAFYATDGDGVAVTYSLSGTDADYFTTAPYNGGGGLYLKSSLDFEDSNHTAKFYSVIVNANSTDGSAAISQLYVLSLVDVNEFGSGWESGGNPTGGNVLENIIIGTSLADFGATDGDGVAVTYSLSDGYQGKYFEIDDNGVLTAKQEFDFENGSHYTALVRAGSTDGSEQVEQVFILTVGNVNDETTGWQENGNPSGGSIMENNEIGLSLADFGATDGDGVMVTYSLSGDDANYFNIDSASGVLSLKSSLDYEDSHAEYYSVVINADSLDGSDGISSLYVLQVKNDAIEIDWVTNGNPSGTALPENTSLGMSVADFNATDDGGIAVTYSLESGYSDAQYFQIDKDSGILTLNGIFDFEDPSVVNHNHRYTVMVEASSIDGSASLNQIFILTVDNISEDTNWQVGGNSSNGESISENNSIGMSFANFNAIDGDKVDVTYSLSGGDANYFNIDTATGTLTAASVFDYETKAYYSVAVVATSTDGSPAISDSFILTISDINNTEDWTSGPSGITISENNSVSLSLGDFNNGGTMEGFSMTYGLSGDDANYFSIDNQSGWFSAASSFDYESAPYYSVVVIANADVEGDAISRVFVLTVGDVDNTKDWSSGPSGITISENNSVGLSLGDFDNHDAIAGVSITYGLSGDDADYFSIGNQTGWFSAASSFDYESAPYYSVVITANADVEGDAISRLFILTVGDVDNTGGWRDIGDDNPEGATIQENNSVGVSVADFDNVIGTGGVLTTYGLSGDAADYFNIDPIVGRITMASSLDYESDYGQSIDNRYSVVVIANAVTEGTAITRLFILTVADVDNTPGWNDGFSLSFGNPSGGAILENGGSNLLLGDFYNHSTPSGINLTYGLSGGNAGLFNIDATTGRLTTKQSFDYESEYGQSINNRYSVAIVANADVDGDAISRVFVLTVGDVDNTNDWNIDTSNGKILNENRASPITLWDFRNDGPLPAGVSITYGVTGGDTDYFDISPRDGGDYWRLRATTSFDYESEYGQSIDNRYSVVITANATEEGNAISRTYILTVGDVSLTPDWSGNPPMGGLVTEDNTIDQALVDFNNDGDLPAGVEVTYGLSGANTSFFQIDNSTGVLKTNHIFDYESTYGQSINNRYSVAIIANATDEGTAISRDYVLTINDIGGFVLAEPDAIPDQPVGINGKIFFDPSINNIGGINDGIGNEGLVIIGNGLIATKYEEGLGLVDYSINNPENFETSFVGYSDANGNAQNHWFFVRDDADDLTGHIVFDADGVDANLDALNNGGTTMTADQINLLAGLNFETDGDFDKPDDLDLDLNDNKAGALTHDQFLSLIGGSNNIDFV